MDYSSIDREFVLQEDCEIYGMLVGRNWSFVKVKLTFLYYIIIMYIYITSRGYYEKNSNIH